jgi:hypothetical protein
VAKKTKPLQSTRRDWFMLSCWAGIAVIGLVWGLWSAYCVATYEKANGSARYMGVAETSPGKTRGGSKYMIIFQGPDRSYGFDVETVGWLGFGYDNGERVNVLYPKGDPESGLRNSFTNLWLFPIILLVFGGGMLALELIKPVPLDDVEPAKNEANLSADEIINRGKKRRKT